MADDKTIELVGLLYDFQYTTPGSRKEAVFLRAGERFRIIEKKSKNWYLVSRLENEELFYVPVLYTNVLRLPAKKPTTTPPMLPEKPKNLLERLQTDLEINQPAPPVINDCARIELFKFLSTCVSPNKHLKSHYFSKLLNKSDSHVDKILHDTQVDKDFKSFRKKDSENFNSLPKPPLKHPSLSENSSPHHEIDPSPPIYPTTQSQISPTSITFENSTKPIISPKLKPPKSTTFSNPQKSLTTTPILPPKPPSTHFNTFQTYKDEASGDDYYYNPITNESVWVIPEVEGNGGGVDGEEGGVDGEEGGVDGKAGDVENKHELSSSSNESYLTGSMELLRSSLDEEVKKLTLSKSGLLNRTKLTEGGRKLKKYWYQTHAVLQGAELSFYKDEKSSLHKSRSDLSLLLHQSLVFKGGTSNKQNLIQVITNTGNEYLLQSNDQSEVEDWFQLLSAASSLVVADDTEAANPKDDGEKDSTTGDASPNPRNSLPSSSSEKARLVERLRMWLVKRPSQDYLRNKGIYKDAIFGSCLAVICDREGSLVPSFVGECMEGVEARGLQVDGIYRVSANIADVQSLRVAVDSNSPYNTTNTDPHILAGALKMFFRELNEPLVPYPFYHPLLGYLYSVSKVEKVRGVIQSFPSCNYETLKRLLKHLLQVVSHSRENRMQVKNLSIIFGPTLLWPLEAVDPTLLASSIMCRGQLVELLLQHYHTIFL